MTSCSQTRVCSESHPVTVGETWDVFTRLLFSFQCIVKVENPTFPDLAALEYNLYCEELNRNTMSTQHLQPVLWPLAHSRGSAHCFINSIPVLISLKTHLQEGSPVVMEMQIQAMLGWCVEPNHAEPSQHIWMEKHRERTTAQLFFVSNE